MTCKSRGYPITKISNQTPVIGHPRDCALIVNNNWMRFLTVISRIIKVEASVISRDRRPRLITLAETLIIPDVTKTTKTVIVILKKLMTNALSQRSQNYFAVHELDITVRKLDIALGNHALRAQPTDYSLIFRYR